MSPMIDSLPDDPAVLSAIQHWKAQIGPELTIREQLTWFRDQLMHSNSLPSRVALEILLAELVGP